LEYGGAPLGAHCFWLKRLVNTQNVPLSKSFIFSAAGINYCHDHFQPHISPHAFLSGWWFGTFFIFHDIWDNPSH